VPPLRKPRALPPGATLAIAAPAGPVDPERFAAGQARLRAAGFRTLHRDDVFARDGYLAGDDARRAAELMAWIRDPSVDGILCARGGYGCDRMLPLLDAEAVRAAAKPLVGYSDVTALLLWQQRRAGLAGFHGPMLDRGDDVDDAAWDLLISQLRGNAALPIVLTGRRGISGTATGPLVGGSLSLVAASLGTPWEIDTRDSILLLEDRDEAPYRVDRMLQQLRAAGKFDALIGVGLGDFSTCTDDRYPERTSAAVIEEVVSGFGIPLVSDLPFGHVRQNVAWPVGGRATLDGERGELAILEQGVESGVQMAVEPGPQAGSSESPRDRSSVEG
jgi:muramoyltetrapeptide carboxypeptidase